MLGLDRVDVLPVDVPLGRRQAQVASQHAVATLEPEPAQEPGRTDIHGDEVELALHVVEAEVVDADDLAAVDVDDLLVEQILPQLDLVGSLLEAGDIDRPGREACPGHVEARDVRPGQEDRAPSRGHDETGDRRIPVADRDDQIVDLADGSPCASSTGLPMAWLR
jgi:hypothetical protein